MTSAVVVAQCLWLTIGLLLKKVNKPARKPLVVVPAKGQAKSNQALVKNADGVPFSCSKIPNTV